MEYFLYKASAFYLKSDRLNRLIVCRLPPPSNLISHTCLLAGLDVLTVYCIIGI